MTTWPVALGARQDIEIRGPKDFRLAQQPGGLLEPMVQGPMRDVKLPYSGRIFYGWIVAGIAALAVFMSGPGQTYGVSTFIDPLMAETGWSRSLVSGLYSGGTLTAGFAMAFIGRQVDRRGYRVMLTVLALAFAGALLFMSTVRLPATLFLGFVMIRMFGQGSLTLVPTALIPQWFVTRRARALTILALGGALSSAALPLVNLSIIANWGWRSMWVFWSAALALVLAPLAWRYTRGRPEDVGLLPDGAPAPQASGPKPASGVLDEDAWTVGEAMRTPAFWIILLCSSIPSMVGTGAQFHHMSIMTTRGVSLTVAAAVFSMSAGVRMASLPFIGYLCDRLQVKHTLFIGLALQAVTILALLAVNSTATAMMVGVFQGLKLGFLALVGGLVWPHYFGRRNLASIRGMATAGMVISSALGPLPFGLGFDIFGGYTEVIWLMAAITLAGAVTVLRLRKPQRAAYVAAAAVAGAAESLAPE